VLVEETKSCGRGRTWAGAMGGRDKGLCILQASWYLQVVLAIGGVKEQKKVMS